MKRTLRILFVFCIMTVCIAMTPVAAQASTIKAKTVSTSSSFTSEWEKTTTYKVENIEVGIMIWGYDTTLINEDYTWTKGYEGATQAGVIRQNYDTAYNLASTAKVNKYSKIEVKHQTYTVQYRIKFTATYTDITSTTEKSEVK